MRPHKEGATIEMHADIEERLLGLQKQFETMVREKFRTEPQRAALADAINHIGKVRDGVKLFGGA